MKIRLKINGLIIFLAVLLLALFPNLFLRKASQWLWDEIMEVVGVFIILLGQLFRVSARGYKAEHSQDSIALVKSGPYMLVRNPMYLGILLIGLGIVLVLFNWWALCVFLFVFMTRYLPLIFKEEKKLSVSFFQEYPAYQKEVPRLMPSIVALFKRDVSEYLPLKSSWLKKEIGSILAVLLITLLLESWEDIKNEGIVTYFRESITLFVVIILFICLMVYLIRSTEKANLKKDVSATSEIAL